jgi:hypothetical protein
VQRKYDFPIINTLNTLSWKKAKWMEQQLELTFQLKSTERNDTELWKKMTFVSSHLPDCGEPGRLDCLPFNYFFAPPPSHRPKVFFSIPEVWQSEEATSRISTMTTGPQVDFRTCRFIYHTSLYKLQEFITLATLANITCRPRLRKWVLLFPLGKTGGVARFSGDRGGRPQLSPLTYIL